MDFAVIHLTMVWLLLSPSSGRNNQLPTSSAIRDQKVAQLWRGKELGCIIGYMQTTRPEEQPITSMAGTSFLFPKQLHIIVWTRGVWEMFHLNSTETVGWFHRAIILDTRSQNRFKFFSLRRKLSLYYANKAKEKVLRNQEMCKFHGTEGGKQTAETPPKCFSMKLMGSYDCFSNSQKLLKQQTFARGDWF